MELFASPIFVSIALALCVFAITYVNLDRVLNFFAQRATGSRNEVLEALEKMLIEVDQKRMGLLLNLSSYGLAAIFFLLAWPNLVAGFVLGASAMIVGWTIPRIITRNMFEKRCSRLVDQMVDGLTIMGNSIKAGQSITQAMERVVENMHGPFPQELNLILNKVRLGQSVEDSLIEFAERVPRQDVQMFVTAVTVLKETGGNLAETFATIVVTIRERQKVEKKIQALTAQGTMQALIVTAVPFFLIGMFFMMDPSYIMPLFTRPLGWFFLALMLGLQILGLVTMKKIVTIKV